MKKNIGLIILLCVGFVPVLRGGIFTDAEVSALQQIIREGYLNAIVEEVRTRGYQKDSPEYNWAIERYNNIRSGKAFGAIVSLMRQPSSFVLYDAQKMMTERRGLDQVYSVQEDAGLLANYIRPQSFDSRSFEFHYWASHEGREVPLVCFPDGDQQELYYSEMNRETAIIPDSTAKLEDALNQFFMATLEAELEGDVASAAGILNFCLDKKVTTPNEVFRQNMYWSVLSLSQMAVDELPSVMMLNANPNPDLRFMAPGYKERPVNTGQLLVDPGGFAFCQGEYEGTVSIVALTIGKKSIVGFSPKKEPWIVFGKQEDS